MKLFEIAEYRRGRFALTRLYHRRAASNVITIPIYTCWDLENAPASIRRKVPSNSGTDTQKNDNNQCEVVEDQMPAGFGHPFASLEA